MLRLYRAPFSTNVERVALALAHKGLDVESVEISYEDRSPVIEVSGQAFVPVLVDGDEVIPDSTRIMRHLEERYPEPPLFPRDPARRAELDVFLEWFNEVWKVAPNTIEDELGRAEPDHDRIAVQSAAFPFLKYAKGRYPTDDELFHRILDDHLRLDGEYPRISAWIDRVNERPRA
jgi:glutathione S-transferase